MIIRLLFAMMRVPSIISYCKWWYYAHF